MTVKEAAYLWAIPENTLRGMIRKGKVAHKKVGSVVEILDQERPEYNPHNGEDKRRKRMGDEAYCRWYILQHGEDKSIGSICKHLGISKEDVCRIYDDIIDVREAEPKRKIIRDMLNELTVEVYRDAVEHQLWEEEMPKDCAERIAEEVQELAEAAGDNHAYAEELADVVIMALSTAGHLGINIGAEVMRKILINHDRPIKHIGG